MRVLVMGERQPSVSAVLDPSPVCSCPSEGRPVTESSRDCVRMGQRRRPWWRVVVSCASGRTRGWM